MYCTSGVQDVSQGEQIAFVVPKHPPDRYRTPALHGVQVLQSVLDVPLHPPALYVCPSTQEEHVEHTEFWVEVHPLERYLPDPHESQLMQLWLPEEDLNLPLLHCEHCLSVVKVGSRVG